MLLLSDNVLHQASVSTNAYRLQLLVMCMLEIFTFKVHSRLTEIYKFFVCGGFASTKTKWVRSNPFAFLDVFFFFISSIVLVLTSKDLNQVFYFLHRLTITTIIITKTSKDPAYIKQLLV